MIVWTWTAEQVARRWLPVLIAFAGLAASVALWRALIVQERAQIHRTTRAEVTTVKNLITTRLETRIASLERLGRRWERSNRSGQADWESEAEIYLSYYRACQAIEWVDTSLHVRWVAPLDGNQADLNLDLGAAQPFRTGLPAGGDRQNRTVPHFLDLKQGGKSLVVIVPIFDGENFRGSVRGVFRLRELLDLILHMDIARGYSVSALLDGKEIYRRHEEGSAQMGEWGEEIAIDILGPDFHARAWPRPELLAAFRSQLPQAALGSGLALAFLLALSTGLFQQARFRAAALAEEILERKRAEEKLKAYTWKLEQSNAALQDFASVVSHDLREPLGKVQLFADRLQTKCFAALNEQGREYLARVQHAAARMQALINDLLELSQVTTRPQPFVAVDLGKIAREVVADLEARIEQTGARVEFNGLPSLEADPTQMRQLLQNLISNALKFHRPSEPPVVKISGRLLLDRRRPAGSAASRELCQILVEDNGIGFEEKYLDRIFDAFQRLHGQDQFEGTGVGLAVCRKIAERHNGSITAKSAPGQGSTFIVTLPARQRQEMTDHEPTRETSHHSDGR